MVSEWARVLDAEDTEGQPVDTESDCVRVITAGSGVGAPLRGATEDGYERIRILPLPVFCSRGPATPADAGDQTAEGS